MSYFLKKDYVQGIRPGGSLKLLSGASVYIYVDDDPFTQTLADIYSDATGTPQPNPLTTDSNGQYSFYGNGYYIPGASKTGYNNNEIMIGDRILVSLETVPTY